MLRQRLITAAIGIPLLIAVLFAGETWTLLAACLVAALACWEIWSMAGARGLVLPLPLLVTIAVLLALNGGLRLHYTAPLLTLGLLATFTWALTRVKRESGLTETALAVMAP